MEQLGGAVEVSSWERRGHVGTCRKVLPCLLRLREMMERPDGRCSAKRCAAPASNCGCGWNE